MKVLLKSHLEAWYGYVSGFRCGICLFGITDTVINWQITKVERGLNLTGRRPGDSCVEAQFPSFHVSVVHIFPITWNSFYPGILTQTLRLIIGTCRYKHLLSFPQNPSPHVFPPPQGLHCFNLLLKQTVNPPPKFPWITLQSLEQIQSRFEDNRNTEY